MRTLFPSADDLSAAALALGALTVIYSLWMPAITGALAQDKQRHRDDRGDSIAKLRNVRKRTALPLAVATTALMVVLMPSAVAVVWETGHHVDKLGLHAARDYQPALAIYVIVFAFLTALVVLTWVQVYKLAAKEKDFKAPDPPR